MQCIHSQVSPHIHQIFQLKQVHHLSHGSCAKDQQNKTMSGCLTSVDITYSYTHLDLDLDLSLLWNRRKRCKLHYIILLYITHSPLPATQLNTHGPKATVHSMDGAHAMGCTSPELWDRQSDNPQLCWWWPRTKHGPQRNTSSLCQWQDTMPISSDCRLKEVALDVHGGRF